MGITLESGRAFGAGDAFGTPPVALVSSDLAVQLWPGQNPLGQRVAFARRPANRGLDARASAIESNSYLVIGVVRTSGPVWNPHRNPELILSRRQVPLVSDMNVVVRVRNVSPQLVRAIAAAMQSAAPQLSASGFKSTQQYVDEDPGDAQALGVGAALAGSVALVLACVGLFAVVAFAVAQRSREIGIRLALGATQRAVVDQFFREGLRLAATGMAIGIPISLAVMRILEAQDESVRVLGVLPVAVVVLTLVAVAMAAAWIPARRAARVDPLVALRSE
jgi:putative ABC transport system permease protein